MSRKGELTMSANDVRHAVKLQMWCDADGDQIARMQVRFRCISPDDAERRARWFARRWAMSLPDVSEHLAAGHWVEVELLMQCDAWCDAGMLVRFDVTERDNAN